METHDDTRDPGTLDRRLARAQAWSGALLAPFLLAHLANQALAALGAAPYDATQRLLRAVYQSPPVEIALVIGPLLVHAAAAVARILLRRRRRPPSTSKAPPAWRTRLHRISGLYLLVFFAGHVAATRGASLLYGVFPGFEGIAFTLRWVPAYFWPYYLGLALAGLFHVTSGLGMALPMLGVRAAAALRRPRALGAIAACGGVALALGLLGFGGALFEVSHPEAGAYARLLQRLGVAHPADP
jgi:succinate dehydrogenase/fumarate reductase cytochrome b subunit